MEFITPVSKYFQRRARRYLLFIMVSLFISLIYNSIGTHILLEENYNTEYCTTTPNEMSNYTSLGVPCRINFQKLFKMVGPMSAITLIFIFAVLAVFDTMLAIFASITGAIRNARSQESPWESFSKAVG